MLREYIWQLAHETHVFADWRGFSEAALPGTRPAGLLRWCSRMVMSTGLSDSCWWIPYLALVLALGASLYIVLPRALRTGVKSRLAVAALCLLLSAMYVVVPVFAMGSFVWDVAESSFPVMNPLGTILAIWLFVALRGRRGVVATLLAPLACAVLFVPFGAYPLATLLALLVVSAVRSCGRRAAGCALCLIAAAAAAACVCAERRWVYDDLSWAETLGASHALRLEWNPCGQELARQLRMERAVVSRDWNAVTKIAGEYGDVMLRMETAYRILAQYRLGRLPDGLFGYPINSPHNLESEDQRVMDGYLLFLEYGMLQQARCYAMELVSKHSWRPDYYRALGDIALVQGFKAEARRYYSQLARMPFRGAFAEGRLRCVAGGTIPPDLLEIAQMARALDVQSDADVSLEMFNLDNLVEKHVYARYGRLRDAPGGMMKMHVAALLLDCEIDRLVSEHTMLDSLYPGHWPVPVQEAVLLHASRLDAVGQSEYLKGVRPGVVQREVFERMRRFSEARDRIGPSISQADAEELWREFSGTYPMYELMFGNVRQGP